MFEKVIGKIVHHRGFGTLESYYANMQKRGISGGPTFDEAKKDFRAAVSQNWRGI
jgi:hypothetical protein